MSLFGDFDDDITTAARPPIQPAMPWIDAYKLEKEKELVGNFLSAHPLDPFYTEFRYGLTPLSEFKADDVVLDQEYTYGGIVLEKLVARPSKNGGSYGILKIEDYSGSGEFFLADKNFYSYSNFGIPNTVIYVSGRYKLNWKNQTMFEISRIGLMSEKRGKLINGLEITLDFNQINPTLLNVITDLMERKEAEGTSRGALKLKVFEPSVNRYIKFDTPRTVPLDRDAIETLRDMELEVSPIKNKND